MSVGQSLMVRQQLELEKALKEKMIHSVMPPKVADWLLRDKPIDDNDDHSYTEDGAILRRVSVLTNFEGNNEVYFDFFLMKLTCFISLLMIEIGSLTRYQLQDHLIQGNWDPLIGSDLLTCMAWIMLAYYLRTLLALQE